MSIPRGTKVKMKKKKIGIVGGLGPLAGADIFLKLVKATPAFRDYDHFDVIFEQHPFEDKQTYVDANYDPRARKFYVYNTIKELEKRGVDIIMLTCFVSHTFIDELQPEVKPKILSIMEALRWHLDAYYDDVRRIGVLTSSFARSKKLFEAKFPHLDVIYPGIELGAGSLAEAIYGAQGIKAGKLKGEALEIIRQSCLDLVEQGAELIIPGFTEIPVILDAIRPMVGIPIVDSNEIYAEYAVASHGMQPRHEFLLGIIGGVGPAATVDFMNKVIECTDAQRDQDHIKMLVEHNPQIPDRTENLINGGTDPTISLYSACQKLEAGGADIIAIPCNTAHAFVDRIQSHISIPIVNMLKETVSHIRASYPDCKTIGLLATTGTVQSGIYRTALEDSGLTLVVPDRDHQDLVMKSIYGERGVKAGYVEGQCKDDILNALAYIVEHGAEIVILGCTELPLMFEGLDVYPFGDSRIPILDPTSILAQKCVRFSRENTEPF